MLSQGRVPIGVADRQIPRSIVPAKNRLTKWGTSLPSPESKVHTALAKVLWPFCPDMAKQEDRQGSKRQRSCIRGAKIQASKTLRRHPYRARSPGPLLKQEVGQDYSAVIFFRLNPWLDRLSKAAFFPQLVSRIIRSFPGPFEPIQYCLINAILSYHGLHQHAKYDAKHCWTIFYFMEVPHCRYT